eukprot:scaffold8542_cov60-Cyclotella_meneghiniana.AAC.2
MFGRQISLDIQEFNVRVFGSLWWQAANGVIVFGTGSLPGGPAQLAPTNIGKKRIIYHPSADFWWGPKYFLVVPYLIFDDPL